MGILFNTEICLAAGWYRRLVKSVLQDVFLQHAINPRRSKTYYTDSHIPAPLQCSYNLPTGGRATETYKKPSLICIGSEFSVQVQKSTQVTGTFHFSRLPSIQKSKLWSFPQSLKRAGVLFEFIFPVTDSGCSFLVKNNYAQSLVRRNYKISHGKCVKSPTTEELTQNGNVNFCQ